MAYIDGDDFIDGAILSFQQANRMKDNFRLATPPANIQPGMLFSDSDDDKLYHEGAAASEEILQATRSDDVNPLFAGVLLSGPSQWKKGADVASAAILPLGDDGNYFDITGAAGITSISQQDADGNNVQAGTVVKLHFDGACLITHDATGLPLPGGANITTAAGDELEFICFDSVNEYWRCTSYSPARGTGKDIVETKTDNYPITTDDFGKTLVMNAADKTFSLPSVSATNIGALVKAAFINTGKLTIDAVDADTIDDSGAGEGIYCEQNGEKYSSIALRLISATEWIIVAAKGIWTTTE